MEIPTNTTSEIELIAAIDNTNRKMDIDSACAKSINLKRLDSDLEIIEEKLANNSNIPSNLGVKIKSEKSECKAFKERKRKYANNIDSNKKFKRKKEEKIIIADQDISITNFLEIINDNGLTPDTSAIYTKDSELKTPIKTSSLVNDNELTESANKEKIKPLSTKKIKILINACREALDVLMKFNVESLQAMEFSLRILKENNILDSKLITTDTLLELIGLALDTNKSSEEINAEKTFNFLKIISNLAMPKTPKSSKVRNANANTTESSKKIKIVLQELEVGSTPLIKNANCQEQTIPQAEIKTEDELCSVTTIDVGSPEKPSKNIITNYFKKLKRTMEEGNESLFANKISVSIAPKFGEEFTNVRRQKLDEELNNQNCEVNYLIENNSKAKGKIFGNNKNSEKFEENLLKFSEPTDRGNTSSSLLEEKVNERFSSKTISLLPNGGCQTNSGQKLCKLKAKLLQFHDNRRPPYWGTWRRKSKFVKPRKPFGKESAFNYEIDSDDEWEEEEEPGESLHGSDDEKEPEEDYEVDNDFFVPHGYLSDDENPEKENMPINAKLNLLEEQLSSELNQKTRKITPVVFGTFWMHKGLPCTNGSVFQDLQLERLQYISWTVGPIDVTEEIEKTNENVDHQSQGKKPRLKATFPEEEVPKLIKIIHGSPQNGDYLARKFLDYWQDEKTQQNNGRRSSLTKKCVLSKIKELATWQTSSKDKKKMCWNVSKETQKEFGADLEIENSEKKPQKCYIWKFIKKGDKTTGLPSEVPQESEVLFLKS